MNSNPGRGRFPPYRGDGDGGHGRGGGGRGRGRGGGDRHDGPGGRGGSGHHGAGRPMGGGVHLVPVKPTGTTPTSSMSWRVLYAVPPNSRPEVGPSGEKIPGPFSPPLRAAMPEQQPAAAPKRPQDELRKENEALAMKQRVQQLLQQAASSPSGGLGTYVGKISHHNNSLIPVLPRFNSQSDPQ
ncbi:hypothetical protein H4R19_003861 [Coemansia spiralis]|nr:hypothetical protein H4R19_003861 [Coemansia spiralis]